MVRIGEKVPELEFEVFQDGQIRKAHISDYRGKWLVMIFYPADFTFVCPTELEDAANYQEQFQRLGAEIVSVSTDTVYAHVAWHEHSSMIAKIKYAMAADPTGKMCREFGTYLESEGVSLRGSFIIDPDGVLKSMEMNENNIGRNSKELLRKLEAAKYVREHKGEVCPARWEPGEKTLKPGVGLVGKL